jgi:hypothetical protein
MKASKEHRVPLSAAALAIIETLRKNRVRKSVGAESTFSQDLADRNEPRKCV